MIEWFVCKITEMRIVFLGIRMIEKGCHVEDDRQIRYRQLGPDHDWLSAHLFYCLNPRVLNVSSVTT